MSKQPKLPTINFIINSPPFSINNAYYRNRTRTQECRKWANPILLQLQCPSVQKKLTLIREVFDRKIHSLHLNLSFFIPSSKFYTKAGHISRKSMDLSNIEKLLIDLIFDKRYNDRIIDEVSITNLNLDDTFVTQLISNKLPTLNSTPYIDVTCSIHKHTALPVSLL